MFFSPAHLYICSGLMSFYFRIRRMRALEEIIFIKLSHPLAGSWQEYLPKKAGVHVHWCDLRLLCVLQVARVGGREDGGHEGCAPGFQVKHYQVEFSGAFQKGQALIQGQWIPLHTSPYGGAHINPLPACVAAELLNSIIYSGAPRRRWRWRWRCVCVGACCFLLDIY